MENFINYFQKKRLNCKINLVEWWNKKLLFTEKIKNVKKSIH